MNNIIKVFSDFKAFYSEINGATLTGAIDVVVVEQPDGTYLCSPFHVRFGKLGVLRSREKIVDIEVNGEPVDIHMKLGESGEAFFVEECPEDDLEILPDHMATSPIPTNEFHQYEEQLNSNTDTVSGTITQELHLPRPRRNSIDLTSQAEPVEEIEGKKFENQVSDFTTRRHTDIGTQRRDLSIAKKEYTTQRLRQEWEAEKEQLQLEEEELKAATENLSDNVFRPITKEENTGKYFSEISKISLDKPVEEKPQDTKAGKKKRRKKSVLKKKNQGQRKNSNSSGSTQSDQNDLEVESTANKELSTSTESSPPTDVVETVASVDPDTPNKTREFDHYFFSDTEAQTGPSPHRPSTPVQSDTEFEVSNREKTDDSQLMQNSGTWKWGELPTQPDEPPQDKKQAKRSMLSGIVSFMKQDRKNKKLNNIDGMYLEDIANDETDPEIAALYFPPMQKTKTEDDRESGNGTSVPQSPTSMEGIKSLDSDNEQEKGDFVAISLCGPIEKVTDDEFHKNQIQFADICSNPTIFSSPNLVVRLNGKYYSWQVACPIVMTLIIYQKPLPNDVCEQLDKLTKEYNQQQQLKMLGDQQMPQAGEESPKGGDKQPARLSWWSWRRSDSNPQPPQMNNNKPNTLEVQAASAVATQTSRANSPGDGSLHQNSEKSIRQESYVAEYSFDLEAELEQKPGEKYRKTLRLSSEQIESLNLKSGINEVEFSVTTAYQGTSRCKCYLFKWKHSDKVVISDIDGTITRSDVLGHILPMVGKDWAQIGVAQLFSKIEQNGYKLLYLSARAIGQSRATREYLRSIRQGNVKLPDGPLLLNPTSLISAFHREVIEKKPEQFKIACLSDIQALFPEKNPFYAGYGNRINDVWAYRAVGIPIMRIFTINTKGELKHEMTQTFQSTYASMAYIVDQVFPPIQYIEEDIEYTSFNYWRDPVPDIPDLDLNLSAEQVNSGRSTPNTISSSQILNKSLPTIPENIKI